MTVWKPDPSFYPSPRSAMKAPRETLAYVIAFDPERKSPDVMAVVDIDPKSLTYSQIVGTTAMPNAGDELHHAGGALRHLRRPEGEILTRIAAHPSWRRLSSLAGEASPSGFVP